MPRILTDWHTAYLKYTEDSEPPQSYHTWCGLACIASALERKVYMQWGRQLIRPNLYIILIGPSGKARKGTALDHARPMIYSSRTFVIEGATTRQKLIRNMRNEVTTYTDNSNGNTQYQCAISYVSSELQVLLGQGNIEFLADLCDWYDAPDTWTYDTKGQGTDRLEGVCLNILGATAPDWMPSMFPQIAMGGGFTSRCIWVVEEDIGKIVEEPTIDESLEGALMSDIERIGLLTGEFTWTANGKERYKKWYRKSTELAMDGKPAVNDPKFANYCSRRGTLIKKVGMLVSASEGNTMQISVAQFDRALGLIEVAEKKMGRTFSGIGSARYAYATEVMMNFIVKHRTVTRSQILRFFYRDIDDYTYEVVARTLLRMKVITVDKQGDDQLLTLVSEGRFA